MFVSELFFFILVILDSLHFRIHLRISLFLSQNSAVFLMENILSMDLLGFPGGSAVKNSPTVQEMQETWV